HLPLEARVFGQKHDAHAALTDQLQNAVVHQPAQESWLVGRLKEGSKIQAQTGTGVLTLDRRLIQASAFAAAVIPRGYIRGAGGEGGQVRLWFHDFGFFHGTSTKAEIGRPILPLNNMSKCRSAPRPIRVWGGKSRDPSVV